MTLKERINAKETRLGRFLKTWATYFFAVCVALDGCLEYLGALPADWNVPVELKLAIIIAGIVTRVAGHLSVDKKKLKTHGQTKTAAHRGTSDTTNGHGARLGSE